MRIHKLVTCLLAIGLLSTGATCTAENGLKDVAQRHGIGWGTLVSPENLGSEVYRETVLREANVVTATAYWKFQTRKQGPDQFDWTKPDQVVEFATRHKLELHGHPLIWATDKYVPDWLLQQPAEDAQRLMRTHIQQVVSRYRGKIALWHVVNEAYDHKGQMQDSYWRRTLGDRFLEYAFHVAHRADPKAKLIYNDFGLLEKDERKFLAVKKRLMKMRNEGLAIHGIGWQMHLTPEKILSNDFPMYGRMKQMAALGFTNYITELDIALKETDVESLDVQRRAFKQVTETFLKIPKRGSITTWDVSDRQSWLGRDAAPLLFDANYGKKPAYQGVHDAFRNLRVLNVRDAVKPRDFGNVRPKSRS